MKPLIAAVIVFLAGGRCVAEFTGTITFNAAGLSEDVEGFRALLKISDEEVFIESMAHGEDLVFLDGAKRRLPFEIVSWDPVRHESEVWIKLPKIRSSGGTRILLRYGAGNVQEKADFRGYRVADVWGDGYDLVLHANPQSDRVSSSAGVSSGSPTAVLFSDDGAVGKSLAFDGVESFVQLHDLRHADHWMTPVEKIGEYAMRSPQGLANDGRHLYFASHNDPKPADIVKVSIVGAKRLTTFQGVGPIHSAGGDFWGKNRTLVFSTGGSANAAGLQEITLAGQPVRYWNLSRLGRGALCAWKSGDRWLLLTSSRSKFKITEVALKAAGGFSVIDQWVAPVSLGVPQGMDYYDGHIYYYTDGGTDSRNRSPGLITKLKLDPRSDYVQYVDQYAILIDNHEAEGLTILDDGTVFAGAAKGGSASVGEVYRVGSRVDEFVSTLKDFTVSVWFKQSKPGATKYPTLFAKGSSVDNRNAFILHTMDFGADSLKVKFGMTAPRWFGIVSAPVAQETWHHAVGVYDYKAGVNFYMDGEFVGKRPHTIQHTVVDQRVPATIGVDIESGQRGHFYPGLIDEIRIAKFASRASRIKASYQNIAHYDDFVKIEPQ